MNQNGYGGAMPYYASAHGQTPATGVFGGSPAGIMAHPPSGEILQQHASGQGHGPNTQQYVPTMGFATPNATQGSLVPPGSLPEHRALSPGDPLPTDGRAQGAGRTLPNTPNPGAPQPVADEALRGLLQFADSLANDSPIKFSDTQRQDMHDFARIGSKAASTGEVMLGLMNRALIQQAIAIAHHSVTETQALRNSFAVYQRAQAQKWEVTQEHKNLVRAVAKKYLIEGDRTNYTKLFDVVKKDLRDWKAQLFLEEIFSHDTRSKSFFKAANVVVISTRNQFREAIESSVGFNKNGVYEGLIAFATRILGQYAPEEGNVTLDCEAAIVVKLALLRRFTMDNKSLVAVAEVPEQADDDEPEQEARPAKRKKADIQPKKGKTSTANSYFGRFEQHLNAKKEEFGTNDITSRAWGRHVYQILERDYEEFFDPVHKASDLKDLAAKHFGAGGMPRVPVASGSGLGAIAGQFMTAG